MVRRHKILFKTTVLFPIHLFWARSEKFDEKTTRNLTTHRVFIVECKKLNQHEIKGGISAGPGTKKYSGSQAQRTFSWHPLPVCYVEHLCHANCAKPLQQLHFQSAFYTQANVARRCTMGSLPCVRANFQFPRFQQARFTLVHWL